MMGALYILLSYAGIFTLVGLGTFLAAVILGFLSDLIIDHLLNK